MKVIVIGANGKTATRVVRLLKENDVHEPVAMIRNLEQRQKFDDLGVATVLADLEYPIDNAIKGCDAIIFAAGSGGQTGKDKTVLVDHIGAIRSMVAAQVHGAHRYVMLSSFNADENSTSKIAHYHKAKAMADRHLMDTDLDMDHYLSRWPARRRGERSGVGQRKDPSGRDHHPRQPGLRPRRLPGPRQHDRKALQPAGG